MPNSGLVVEMTEKKKERRLIYSHISLEYTNENRRFDGDNILRSWIVAYEGVRESICNVRLERNRMKTGIVKGMWLGMACGAIVAHARMEY